MDSHPVIGLRTIYERYFVDASGQKLISFSTFAGMSKEMQDAGAVMRFEVKDKGRKRVRIVAIDPVFMVWMHKKFCKPKKREFCIPVVS